MLTSRQLGALVLLTLMWGVNWPMMKFSLRELSPLYFRAVTMSGGALCLLAFFVWRRVDMRLPWREAGRVAWLALPNIVGWHFFSILGLKELASGRASILGFTMPVWTVLIGALLAHEKLHARVYVSVVAAVAAVGLLSAHELASLAGRPVGVLWMQLAAASWALGTLLMRRTQTALPTEAVTVWMMLMGAAFFWVVAPIAEPAPTWQFSAAMWASLAYGVFLNYGYAQIIWFGLARQLPPSASAFSVMAVPVVGTLAATLIVGERPGWTDLVAIVCVSVAIASALLPRKT
ncbi:DMT family transporter [Calidifontimicrobium sp. SYSU G02091]|uniref:DMT family transporter n=1 Tax=Calidifontimicrobium sp. SYSU G02091 TaxID=2926421 RepID=UPI001F53963A|nr:DMT family transporter [Calidifontimicrobium sp. SYSU G02091]